MKKAFMFVLTVVLFVCQSSFAFTKSEFTFGIDKILTYSLKNSINYTDGKKDIIKKMMFREEGKEREVEFVEKVDNVLILTLSKDYGNNGFAPKVEYCYCLSAQEDDVKTSVGLGINKFFNSDFDPFNVYAILKATLLTSHKAEDGLSLGASLGCGVFNYKYETTKETFKTDKVYSAKVFVKLDYKNFFVDLSAMTNIIPIDVTINTQYEGVKRLEKNINYDVIMLGIGYKFAI
jgi:uncharacterized protein YxeA